MEITDPPQWLLTGLFESKGRGEEVSQSLGNASRATDAKPPLPRNAQDSPVQSAWSAASEKLCEV